MKNWFYEIKFFRWYQDGGLQQQVPHNPGIADADEVYNVWAWLLKEENLLHVPVKCNSSLDVTAMIPDCFLHQVTLSHYAKSPGI